MLAYILAMSGVMTTLFLVASLTHPFHEGFVVPSYVLPGGQRMHKLFSMLKYKPDGHSMQSMPSQ